MAGEEWCSVIADAGPVMDVAPQESCRKGAKRERREGRKEGRRKVKCKTKERWSLKSIFSWGFPPRVVSEVSLGGSLMWDNLVSGNMMSSTVWSNEKVSTTEHRLLSHVFASFPLFSFNILICASVYVKRKKGEGFCFRTETLYDSCFLCFDLRAVRSPRINHFRLSKQFPITVSIFRFVYGGEKRGPCMLTLSSLSGSEEGRTWFYPLRLRPDIDLCRRNEHAQTNMHGSALTHTSARPYALKGQLTGRPGAPWKHPPQSLIWLSKHTSAPQCQHLTPTSHTPQLSVKSTQALISKPHPVFFQLTFPITQHPTL